MHEVPCSGEVCPKLKGFWIRPKAIFLQSIQYQLDETPFAKDIEESNRSIEKERKSRSEHEQSNKGISA